MSISNQLLKMKAHEKMSQNGFSSTSVKKHCFPLKKLNCKMLIRLTFFHDRKLICLRYSRLEKQNVSNQVTASNDLSIVRPLSDEDFENAIKILEASTSAIEEQNRSFNIQQEALAEFQKKNGRAQTQLKRATSLRQRNLLQEKQNTLLAVTCSCNILAVFSSEFS